MALESYSVNPKLDAASGYLSASSNEYSRAIAFDCSNCGVHVISAALIWRD